MQLLSSPLFSALCLIALALSPSAARAVDFEKEIWPILEENCRDCHGPDKQKAGLRIDKRAILLRGGDSGLASIVPESPLKSHLLELIRSSGRR